MSEHNDDPTKCWDHDNKVVGFEIAWGFTVLFTLGMVVHTVANVLPLLRHIDWDPSCGHIHLDKLRREVAKRQLAAAGDFIVGVILLTVLKPKCNGVCKCSHNLFESQATTLIVLSFIWIALVISLNHRVHGLEISSSGLMPLVHEHDDLGLIASASIEHQPPPINIPEKC